jgi:hypothetical protein
MHCFYARTRILNERKLKIICDRIIGSGVMFALIILECLQGIFPSRVRETFELNQLKSAPSQLLPVFSAVTSLQWTDNLNPRTR